MLQSFSIKTYSMLKENLYDEVVVHKNLKPLAPFLILYPLAGAALMASKAAVTGGFHRAAEKALGKAHQHDRWDTFLDEFRDIQKHPWAGALKFYLDSLCTITGMERTKRWTDIGMLAAMGESKKVEGEARYFATDETEQGVGGLYSDLFWVQPPKGKLQPTTSTRSIRLRSGLHLCAMRQESWSNCRRTSRLFRTLKALRIHQNIILFSKNRRYN